MEGISTRKCGTSTVIITDVLGTQNLMLIEVTITAQMCHQKPFLHNVYC